MTQAANVNDSTSSSSDKANANADETPNDGRPNHLHLVTDESAETMRTGPRMRRAREAMGLSIQDVAKKLHLRADYLEALEEMHVKLLPNGYINGYIRAYARLVGMGENETIAAYNSECGALTPKPAAAPVASNNDNTSSNRSLPVFAALGAVVVIAGGIAAMTLGGGSSELPAATAVASPEIAAPIVGGSQALVQAAATPSAKVAELEIGLFAVRRAKIEVRGSDGTKYIDKTIAAGSSYLPRLNAGWTVTTDDGGAFEWRLDDKVLAPLGQDGVPVYALRIDGVVAELAEKITPTTASADQVEPQVQ